MLHLTSQSDPAILRLCDSLVLGCSFTGINPRCGIRAQLLLLGVRGESAYADISFCGTTKVPLEQMKS